LRTEIEDHPIIAPGDHIGRRPGTEPGPVLRGGVNVVPAIKQINIGVRAEGQNRISSIGGLVAKKQNAEQQRWGNAINVVLPRFKNGGTHINVSGAAVAKYAPNRKEAIQLLEFLSSDHAQAIYAQSSYEYPVKPGVKIDPIISSFGKLNIDNVRLSEIAKYRKAANLLVDKVQFNH